MHGSCNCGQVQFEIDGKVGPIGQCHCSKCRKGSGTDGNAVFYTAASSLKVVAGDDSIVRYSDGGWGHTFCAHCGSPVPHLHSNGKIWFVPAGAMDDDIGHQGYAAHIFVGSKAPWVAIADDAPQYEEGFDSPRCDGVVDPA